VDCDEITGVVVCDDPDGTIVDADGVEDGTVINADDTDDDPDGTVVDVDADGTVDGCDDIDGVDVG
jgi:hypothetical protein